MTKYYEFVNRVIVYIVLVIAILLIIGIQYILNDKTVESNLTDDEVIIYLTMLNNLTALEEKDNNMLNEQTIVMGNDIGCIEQAILKDIDIHYSWWYKKNKKNEVPWFSEDVIKMSEQYKFIYLYPNQEKVIYLTFDEGYENGNTLKILSILGKENIKATFFITGSYLEKNIPLVEKMIEEGHLVANHTMNHLSLPTLKEEDMIREIQQLEQNFNLLTGKKITKFLRPPSGEYSERVALVSKKLEYRLVFWSLAYRDWEIDNQKGYNYAYQQVIDYYHPGAVILLHAVSKDNADALEKIIKELKARGYQFRLLE